MSRLAFKQQAICTRFGKINGLMTNIFVGNLDITATAQQLRELSQPTERSKPSRLSRTGTLLPRGIRQNDAIDGGPGRSYYFG